MADQAIHWLFPTPVLQADLTPTADVALAMDQQLAYSIARSFLILSSAIATTSPAICWAKQDWINCIAWKHSSG